MEESVLLLRKSAIRFSIDQGCPDPKILCYHHEKRNGICLFLIEWPHDLTIVQSRYDDAAKAASSTLAYKVKKTVFRTRDMEGIFRAISSRTNSNDPQPPLKEDVLQGSGSEGGEG